MLEFHGLAKSFGDTRVLDALTFRVDAGEIVGLLGRNGAGKSTAMRILCGLEKGDSGSATVLGQRYATLANPASEVGVLLDPRWLDDRLTCAAQLTVTARLLGIASPKGAVAGMLHRVGLDGQGATRIARLSLGMRQRLAIGIALLGGPRLLILDEPVNGLDADGVLWLRAVLREFARDGGAVLLSSHLMSEMELVADRVVIIDGGIVVADRRVADLGDAEASVVCRVEDGAERLMGALAAHGVEVQREEDDLVVVSGADPGQVFRTAVEAGCVLVLLALRRKGLEETYLDVTRAGTAGASSGGSIAAP